MHSVLRKHDVWLEPGDIDELELQRECAKIIRKWWITDVKWSFLEE
jgi:hypothetical protein